MESGFFFNHDNILVIACLKAVLSGLYRIWCFH